MPCLSSSTRRAIPAFRASRALLVICTLAASAWSAAAAQAPVDSSLAGYINAIRAIDDHAHPMLPVPVGARPDTDYDALPLDGIPAFDLPSRLRPTDPVWRAAQRALYQVSPELSGAGYHTSLQTAVANAKRTYGARFPRWALDQARIDVMMANRITMGPGLSPPRFRWIAFDDALMLPLDVRGEASLTPDDRSLYPREATLLRRYLQTLGVRRLPPSLDEYVRTVVAPTIAHQRADGAVGIKFEAAYLRALDFADPDAFAAHRVYAKYVHGGVPSHAEYKALEDYLFRAISREAGRQHLVVQIHTLETFGGFYRSAGSAPHLLEPAFNDSTLRGTKFIIVHGGWPLVGETQGLLTKPNVYTDISMMDVMLSPTVLARVLRQWLGEWPDKVMFGTDAFDGGVEQGWEQVAWVGSTTARRALAIALTGMMRDGEISRARAETLARMVMRENAASLYGLH